MLPPVVRCKSSSEGFEGEGNYVSGKEYPLDEQFFIMVQSAFNAKKFKFSQPCDQYLLD